MVKNNIEEYLQKRWEKLPRRPLTPNHRPYIYKTGALGPAEAT
jgi:hypothetical protein